jgi:hypothetical protein
MHEEILKTYKLKDLVPFILGPDGEPVTYQTVKNRNKDGRYLKILIGHRKTKRKKDGKHVPEYAYIHPKLGKLIMDAMAKGYFDQVL